MNDTEVAAYLDAAAAALSLKLQPEWRAEVAANLQVLFALGDRLMAFDMGDEAEVAPVYRL